MDDAADRAASASDRAGRPGSDATGSEEAIRKPALLVATKVDRPGAVDALELLELRVNGRLPVLAVSATDGSGLEDVRRRSLTALDVIRAYTKPPGKCPDPLPPRAIHTGASAESERPQSAQSEAVLSESLTRRRRST